MTEPSTAVPDTTSPETSRGLSDDGWANLLGIVVVLVSLTIAAVLGDSILGWIGKPASWKSSPLSEGLMAYQKTGKPVKEKPVPKKPVSTDPVPTDPVAGGEPSTLNVPLAEQPPTNDPLAEQPPLSDAKVEPPPSNDAEAEPPTRKIRAWVLTVIPIAVIGLCLVLPLAIRRQLAKGIAAYLVIASLGVLAMLLAGQEVIKYYNLEYVLWALVVGFVISNTIGTPTWIKSSMRGEFFIKWGLILLGMEVLMGKLILLGLPGIMVSWIVTPIVLVGTFWFGQRILKIDSPSLNMTVSADMSVCGVSAAIATGAACRAKKEELSLAISLSLAFTAVMMVVMPLVIKAVGIDDLVGGAWMGGTIDSTGAVAAAGKALGDRALYVATTVKMIQNILIGVIAFCVSVYWAYRYPTDHEAVDAPRLGLFSEIWKRFPKFILGFIAVSITASLIDASGKSGSAMVAMATNGITKELRNWLFCLAFVCSGLEMHLKTFAASLRGGKPLVLYVAGQTFNLLLTGLMSWLTFGYLFRDTIEQLLPK